MDETVVLPIEQPDLPTSNYSNEEVKIEKFIPIVKSHSYSNKEERNSLSEFLDTGNGGRSKTKKRFSSGTSNKNYPAVNFKLPAETNGKPTLFFYPRVSIQSSRSTIIKHGITPLITEVSNSVLDIIGLQKIRMSAISSTPDIIVSQPPANNEETEQPNKDYYEYLLMCRKFSETNCIQQMGSGDIVYQGDAVVVKNVGLYVLGDVIGKGAFGKVKEGFCSSTLSRVAVKIIHKKRARKVTNGIENVIREIKMLRLLKHTNVVTLYDVLGKVQDKNEEAGIFNWFLTIEEEPLIWEDGDGVESERIVQLLKWYLVFEYCPCSLQTLIEQNGCMTEDYARKLFVQLAGGIMYLHSMGIIHRDIKPANILLTTDNVVKISDFGIAEQFSMYSPYQMRTSSFAGTHKFLSPEVVNGSKMYDGTKVDIWAAGVTLYNMLTGKFPFEGVNNEKTPTLSVSLYHAIINFPMQNVEGISEQCVNLLQVMLEKDPEIRTDVQHIQHHTWCCHETDLDIENFSPILSYPILDEGKGSQGLSIMLDAVETTILPYLEALYENEVNAIIRERGLIANESKNEGTHIPDLKSGKRRNKWMARIFKKL